MSRTIAEVRVFDPKRLRLGDVVLEFGGNLGSVATAVGTYGRYSHALIWVGDDFVEAMPDGVRALSYMRVPVQKPSRWRLMRVAPEHAAIAASAAVNARNMVFKEYDLWGALRTVVGPRREPLPESTFCSQLVARSYQDAGLKLARWKTPEGITPNDLSRSRALFRERSMPLLDAKSLSGDYPREFLDRTTAYASSPMALERRINRELVLSDLLQTHPPAGYAPPGNLSELLMLLPHFDRGLATKIADSLLEGMIAKGYFDLLTQQIIPIWFQKDQSSSLQPSREEAIRRNLLNAEGCNANDQIMPHPIWMRLRVMYTLNATGLEALRERGL